jgi:FG-GAP repeat
MATRRGSAGNDTLTDGNGVFLLAALDGHNGSRFDAPNAATGNRNVVGLAIIGDINNDGPDDFAIGTPGVGSGSVYVLTALVSTIKSAAKDGECSTASNAVAKIPAATHFGLRGAAVCKSHGFVLFITRPSWSVSVGLSHP